MKYFKEKYYSCFKSKKKDVFITFILSVCITKIFKLLCSVFFSNWPKTTKSQASLASSYCNSQITVSSKN